MIGGIIFGVSVCVGLYMIVGLGVGAIADNARNRRYQYMADEDEIDFRYYGNHYGEDGGN